MYIVTAAVLLISLSMLTASEGCADTESWRDSLGFFCDSAQAWRLRKHVAAQQYQRNLQSIDARYRDGEDATRGRYVFQKTWEPELHCTFMERIGDMGDGGKWICDPYHLRSHDQCLVYSIGSNNQFDLENDLLKSHPYCEVHTLDHTSLPPQPFDDPRINFHSLRLAPYDDPKSQSISLASIVRQLNHTGRAINVLKIDIEGREWEVLSPLLTKGSLLESVVQILIELHMPPLTATQYHQMMVGLHSLGFVVYSKEPNTLGCAGDCIEFSLLRLSPSVLAGIGNGYNFKPVR